jgi:S-DNA-T family DNA segregation ATPase FtsK/SpoIIIE
MASRRKKNSSTATIESGPRKSPARPFWGIVLITVGVLVLVALFDFDKAQSRHLTTDIENIMQNKVGYMGAEFAFFAFKWLGIGAFFVPFYIFSLSARYFTRQLYRKRWFTGASVFLSIIAIASLAGIAEDNNLIVAETSLFKEQLIERVGGDWGHLIGAILLKPFIGSWGSALILVMMLTISSIVILTDDLSKAGHYLIERWRTREERRARRREEKAALKAAAAKAQQAALISEIDPPQRKTKRKLKIGDDESSNLLQNISVQAYAPVEGKSGKVSKINKSSDNAPDADEPLPPIEVKKPPLDPAMVRIVSGEKVEKAMAAIPDQRGDYKFPPLELLAEAQDIDEISPEDHRETMEALVRTLDEFGVKVLPGEIHTGPVITRYEVTPAPGVRVEKIANLDKNIALGLRALSVRILAPVPGKGSVGVEVPNRKPSSVCMREIVESKAWAESKAEIPIVLGKDVTGKPIVTDLTKMPHVLIAGSTGSGKTVCINAVIASLLYHSGPEDLRFIMVDPKVVEMQVYNELPHMLIPVVTEAKKVPGALKWLIAEMERRYQIFAKENVRNIAGFNAKIIRTKEEAERAMEMDAEMTAEERYAVSQVTVPRDDDAFEIPRKKLPYIVCIIDELADLMMVAPADIETCIARLAQLARAAGIHLILATQRPSVNVITGVIKANLPCRISFKVASKVDSRTILDGGGAESLIGKGDMLFIPPGTSNLTRAQGAFVSDEEINAIVAHIRDNNDPPIYAEEVQRQIESESGDSSNSDGLEEDGDGDELIPDAIDVLRATKRASTSMLQRRLRIGYNRAARIMEILEDRGVVGPENGSSPREILVDLDSY